MTPSCAVFASAFVERARATLGQAGKDAAMELRTSGDVHDRLGEHWADAMKTLSTLAPEEQHVPAAGRTLSGDLDEATEELAKVLYNMALLNSGFSIDDPTAFTNPL